MNDPEQWQETVAVEREDERSCTAPGCGKRLSDAIYGPVALYCWTCRGDEPRPERRKPQER